MKPVQFLSLAVPVALGLAIAAPGSASATPADGVNGIVMSQATLNGKDYISREITIAPGGTTGWHYHPGQVFGVIRAGTLTHYDGDCSVDGVYNAGDAITERSGTGYVHEGRNEGSTPLVMWVLYIDPAGSPLAVDMPNPGCPFQ
ncbi:cupin domain-containing protein [Mycolicibacterium sphagni]|jgi:quercetin dioxygenase-like cupin family protein|uniref:cupin domain-containing protein n=1 Tax=Mycolicibacterium sphagni TaxID=1786 RepID=UPI0021F34D4B|nr:cupin domain-containing protein [Mycolicibacterium sphagni]MCV7176246.1 cupin domain-containing protein [Mycolicibacterium sphagni]